MAFKNARKPGGKKTVGSGGKNRKALKGKGPTPKAKDRPAHVKYRDKKERNPKNTRSAQFTKEPRRCRPHSRRVVPPSLWPCALG